MLLHKSHSPIDFFETWCPLWHWSHLALTIDAATEWGAQTSSFKAVLILRFPHRDMITGIMIWHIYLYYAVEWPTWWQNRELCKTNMYFLSIHRKTTQKKLPPAEQKLLEINKFLLAREQIKQSPYWFHFFQSTIFLLSQYWIILVTSCLQELLASTLPDAYLPFWQNVGYIHVS